MAAIGQIVQKVFTSVLDKCIISINKREKGAYLCFMRISEKTGKCKLLTNI